MSCCRVQNGLGMNVLTLAIQTAEQVQNVFERDDTNRVVLLIDDINSVDSVLVDLFQQVAESVCGQTRYRSRRGLL